MKISKRLTERNSGELTLCAEDSRARTYPVRVSSRGSTGSVRASGTKCLELLHRRDPLGLLLKTLLTSSLWGSTLVSLAWKPRATPQGRLLFQLQQSVLSTEGSDVFLLGTPTTNDAKNSLTESQRNRRTLSAHLLPTPAASQAHKPLRNMAPSEADGTHGLMLVGAFGDGLEQETGERGWLNPCFVEMMQGFPPGWTSLEK